MRKRLKINEHGCVRYVYRLKNGGYRGGAMSLVIAKSIGLKNCDAPCKEYKHYRLHGWSDGVEIFFESEGK